MKLTDAELSELERLDCESKELVMADPEPGCLCPYVYNANLWSRHATALLAEVREAREKLGRAEKLWAAFVALYSTMTAINQHRGYEFSQPLLNAHDALKEWEAK